jgi:integrase
MRLGDTCYSTIAASTHPKIVIERLGHANISMPLAIYYHVLPNMPLETVRKLEDIFD